MKLDRKTCLRAGITIFLVYLGITLWPAVSRIIAKLFGAAMPILVGCIIAYLINILLTSYERLFFPHSAKQLTKKSRRPICLALAVITLLAIIALVVWLVVPQLVSCVKLIIAALPGAISATIEWLDKFDLLSDDILSTLSSIDWQSRIGQIANVLSSGIGNVMDVIISAVTSVFSGIVTAFLSIIFAVYLLLSKDRLSSQLRRVMKRYLPEKISEKIYYVAGIFNSCFRGYIVGQCTEAVILGILCMLGMLILRIPYAAMVGALVAFTALIPIAGSYIGAAVGAFMILTVSPIKALVFLIFLVVLQQLEGNLIYPRVVGSSLGLPGIWVLAAVTVGGGMMGISGMLIGVPLAAALYRIIRNDVNNDPTCNKH